MSLSKYPEQLDLFQVKKDAAFDGDPNGDDVMADDINALQDSIGAIETALGVNPQGSKLNVGERISLLEGSAALRVPSFLIYLGAADKINGATTTDEATGHFVKFDHIVLGNNAEDVSSESYEITKDIIKSTKANREIKIYGYIDCSVNTTNLSIAEIQVKIQAWESIGADGIYCDNFGYENEVSRDRQNQILDSIHQYGMVAIMQSSDAEKLLTDAYDENMNQSWIAPHVQDGDIYHYQQFAVDTATTNKYTDAQTLVEKMTSLYNHRSELGVRIFATSYVASNTNLDLAQSYYEWAHALSLLTSVDAFYPVSEGYAKVTNTAPAYNWTPIAGNWYMNKPIISIDTQEGTFSRETVFGKIIVNNIDHTYRYEGLYIPFELLKIAANSIDGSLLKDSTIEDKKIKSYNGKRLIDSINADTSTDTIDIRKVATFGYDQINGSIPTDVLKVNVIDAINAHIGTAFIDQAFIGDLNANHITAGTIDAGRITASVVDALNLYADNAEIGHATIKEAVIGNLSAEKITAGSIDAARIQANVISAININAQGANIQNLNATHITAGDINADRIKTNIINAINAYADQMVVGSAVINSATVGNLTAQHIQGAVIAAINLSADTATINNAKIGSLSVDNMKAAVVEAINLKATNAVIDQANIGNLSATKITAGTLDADIIKGSVMSAIQFSTENAVIDQAKIGNLNADKITAGDISADRLRTNIVNAINVYAQNMTADSAKINVGTIGDLTSNHIKGAVIEAINISTENLTVDAGKIGILEVNNMKAAVIAAVNASIEDAVIDQAQIGDLAATKITTGDLNANRIKSSVITAINGSFENITIDAGKIGSLEVDNLKAGVIQAVNASIENITINSGKIGVLNADKISTNVIAAINANIGTAHIDKAIVPELDAAHIQTNVIEAINAKITNTTIDNAVVGQLGVDNMKGTVVEAVNSYTGVAVIGEGKIGNLSAGKITSGTIDAQRISGSVIAAVNANIGTATIDKAVIPQLDAAHIETEIIKAINASVETATIDAAQIGDLEVDNLKAAVISAINASIENVTINSAQVGVLSADKMRTNIMEAVNFWAGTAHIDEALIQTLNASKINAGDIAADRMTTNAISAINADISDATIDAAQIGTLKAENIEAEVIKAINASIETATIDAAQIGTLKAENMQTEILKAINASIETAKISQAQIGALDATKITTGDLAADRIMTNVVTAINADLQTAQIAEAKIGNLSASKITAGDIAAARLQANVVSAINTYTQSMTAQSAKIDSAVMGTLAVDHMQAKVISAINASVETISGNNAVINNAKIGALTADHIKAVVLNAIQLSAESAVIDQAKIGNLDATKITTGDIAAQRMTTNAITAINADLTTATIDAAQIGVLKAENIQAEVIKAINASIETALIDSANISALDADHIKASVISAINASVENITINNAKIGALDADHIKAAVITAINASVENIKINNAMIDVLTANHIKAQVVEAINLNATTAKIDAGKIGVLEADNIKAGIIDASKINVAGLRADQITSGYISAQRLSAGIITSDLIKSGEIQTQHMQAGSISGDRISAGTLNADRLIAGTLDASFIKAGTITSELIAAGGITARNIAVNSITADMIQANSITAEHISTKGLDAQSIQVYNGKTGEVLIGGGYLRVDGLDVGVIQSDNLIGNGAFITSSSGYGYLRDNPSGEAILGGKSTIPGGHQLWKINLADGTVFPIDLGAKKPVDFAIDADGVFGYVTMQGNDTLVQVDLANNTRTGTTLDMGKGPGRIYYSGGQLQDMKHFFVTNTDPDDVNIPDTLTVVDAPSTSIDQKLYVHHVVPLGNKPYDVVTSSHHMTFVTLADQGDIAVLEMTNPNSMNWKPVRNIPIAAYMTDNYHGGMPGNVGLNEVTGGDSASQYDTKMEEMSMPGHNHGGYGVTDGSLIKYEPHGLALSSDPEILYVADYANGYLIIVDINGKAPYNALSGSRQQGNLGVNGYPMGMGPNKPNNPPSGPPPAGGGMVMSVGEPTFEIMDAMPGMGMGGGTDITTSGGRIFSKDQAQHTTHYVWYRIPVGNSPEFVKVANGYIFTTVEGTGKVAVIKEQDIIDNLTNDRWYYTNYDEFTQMNTLPMWDVNYINVGSKPSHMHYDDATKRLYVTVNGQNQVVIIDTATFDPMNPDASIVQRINVGANPKGITVDSSSTYMYVVNHGGTGNLSFVYPDTASYIGDPYVGLEGGVEYQGADFWAPTRSEWVEDTNRDVVAASTVEFHINEPFLNEGGYVKLTAYNDGKDAQYAYIEQDIVNVTNYSNGNNIQHKTGERLTANGTYTIFTPNNPWMQDPGVTNVKIKGTAKNETLVRGVDNRTFTAANKWQTTPQPPTFTKVLTDGTTLMVSESSYTIHYPTTDSDTAYVTFNSQVEAGANIIVTTYYWWKTATGYTVEYNTGAYIQFPLGTVTEDQWVEADYTHHYNMWFKYHNGSIAVAQEQGSSDNFYTKFEIDEFVPKYVTYDNLQTSPFTYSPIARAGTNASYTGIEYSTVTNRAMGMTVTSSAAPTIGTLNTIVNGVEPDELEGDVTASPVPASTTVTLPSGLQSIVIDLGKTYMIGRISVAHSYGLDRKYHNTKTEVSEDGVTWTTAYDSAVSGEYSEKPVYHSMHGHTHYAKFLTFSAKPVRYVRDWVNGWTSGDGLTSGTENDWTEIRAYGDWEFDTSYVYPESAPNAGDPMATNGRGIVSTDISGAYAAIDIPIDFTSKWYMTYLIGPEFGMADVEMSSMMGMTHSLTMDAPVLSTFQHKHIMFWPPSNNVKDDPGMSVKAGMHRATIRQKSGRINIDRFRFEDYQYFDRNSSMITPDKSSTFRRTKIVPAMAQWYIGDAVQSSEGAYDTLRLNPDTGLPDYSVAIKYRMRFRVDLAEGATLGNGTRKSGRGIAYATSAIFETGKLSTHWRRSESMDSIPGTQIEAWDGNHPHKTGIQHFHLANGAVNGNKLSPLSVMDHHISPYAMIQESKLKLDYPTHQHGRPIMSEVMPGMMMQVGWIDNKPELDKVEGWGTSGTQNVIARADHLHDDRYVLKDVNGSLTGLDVQGDITVTGLVDGVDVSQLKSNFDTHTTDTTAHLTSTEHTKLTGISTGATKTQSNVTNGHITIDGIDVIVYAHPSTDGNLHVPATSTTNNGKFLKAGSTAGNLSWAQIAFTDISGSITSTQHGTQTDGSLHANASQTVNGFMSYQDKGKLDGVSAGANKVVASSTNGYVLIDGTDTKVYAHPTGDGNLHIPANSTTNNTKVIKATATAGNVVWGQVQFSELGGTLSATQHAAQTDGTLHAAATQSVNGFMSSADKLKLDNIQSSSINQTTADGRYVKIDGTSIMTGNLVIKNGSLASGIELGKTTAVESPYIDFHSSGTANDYDVRIVSSGGTSGTNGQGTLTVNAATLSVPGNISVTGTVDGVDVSSFKSSYDTHTKVPNPPTTLALTEDGVTMDVRFVLSDSAEVTEYEIWASFADTAHYEIVSILNKADIAAGTTTYTFIDDSYTRTGTIYYRIYAKNGSVRSTALEGSAIIRNIVADPMNLNVVANVDSFDIYYTVPQDRRLDHIEVVIDKQAVEANLAEANGTIVYSGLADHYTYKIPSADYDKFHNVWVRSVTRT